MTTTTRTRVLVSAASGALALGALAVSAPAASAHGAEHGARHGQHGTTRHDDRAHRHGHAWGHASLKASRVVVSESAGTATVTLRLTKKAPKDATFTWTTFDKSPSPGEDRQQRHGGSWSDHLATAGQDYTASSGTVTIAAGTRRATVSVPITDDTTPEKAEAFFVRFAPTKATTSQARKAAHREGLRRGWCAGPRGRATSTVVITDND